MNIKQLHKDLASEIKRINKTKFLNGTIHIKLPEPTAQNNKDFCEKVEQFYNDLNFENYTRHENKLFHTSRDLTVIIYFSNL